MARKDYLGGQIPSTNPGLNPDYGRHWEDRVSDPFPKTYATNTTGTTCPAKIGERWYVKVNAKTSDELQTIEILGITGKTVEFKFHYKHILANSTYRYKIDDVEFVELANESLESK